MNRRHLDADRRRLFPNSGFRHSELGSKIFNAPKAHKYKELISARTKSHVQAKSEYRNPKQIRTPNDKMT